MFPWNHSYLKYAVENAKLQIIGIYRKNEHQIALAKKHQSPEVRFIIYHLSPIFNKYIQTSSDQNRPAKFTNSPIFRRPQKRIKWQILPNGFA